MMRLRTLFAVGGSAIVLGAAVLVAQPAFAATASAAFSKTSAWDTGYTGQFRISASGTGSVNGWTVIFDLPAGATLGSFWDALITSSGNRYTAKNREYNGTIPSGSSVTFGFVAAGTGSPTNCTVNGGSCSGGGGGPDTSPPSMPTGLRVTGVTTSSISLGWNASTDNVGVTGYQVRRGTTTVGSPTGTSFTNTGLANNTTYTFQVRARDAAGNFSAWSGSVSGRTGTPPPPPPPPPAAPATAAPYLYLGWGNPPSATSVMSATGIRAYTMAFVLSGGGCSPAWDGMRPLTGGTDQSTIRSIQSAGGQVIPSFGGWQGNKLGPNCGTPDALAGAVMQVVNAYNLSWVDLDIENIDEFENEAIQDRWLNALRIVKTRKAGLRTIVTFGTTTSGPNFWGNRLIQRAKALNANVDVFTIMPFDFGGGGNMVASTTSAVEGLRASLQSTFGWSADTAYRHIGISGMNGLSDQRELTSPSTWTQIRDYASSHHLARLAFWSVNRDRGCPNGGVVSDCSGIDQTQWQFTRITAGFRG
jgi:Cellulose binding domain/Fibronectin type III domain/Glycosyl hydrolases family 18